MENTMNTAPPLAQLRAMQADPFRARELLQMRDEAAQGLRDLTRQLALHLAAAVAPPHPEGKRHNLAAGRQRERRSQACQALAEEMILQALVHRHDPQWDPCADTGDAPAQEHASLLLTLLRMDEPDVAHHEQEQQENDAWMEP